MKSIIELLVEMVGFLILIFSVVWVFIRFTGYGEFYDKMLYDVKSDVYIKIKNQNKGNNENTIHNGSIKKTNSKWKQHF